jgi:CheY-like chemotaxis protein
VQRILIADDDPVSLRFLVAVAIQLGFTAVAVADGSAALAAALDQPFDLLLLDRKMPGLGGAEMLTALRTRGDATPAIATSAEVDKTIMAQLRAAGFVDIVEKPTTLERLGRALRPHLQISASLHALAAVAATATLLDEGSALAAIGGDATALRALRVLLAQELVALLAHSAELGDDGSAWREHLHRLRASCGFCGAAALAEAAARLERGLRDDPANAQPVLCDFLHLCRATLAALPDQGPSAIDGARISPSIPQARKPPPSR